MVHKQPKQRTQIRFSDLHLVVWLSKQNNKIWLSIQINLISVFENENWVNLLVDISVLFQKAQSLSTYKQQFDVLGRKLKYLIEFNLLSAFENEMGVF